MKHIRPLTQQPQAAQTTIIQVKLDFIATAIPTVVQMWHNKNNGGALPF